MDIQLNEDLLKSYSFAYNNSKLIEFIIEHSLNFKFDKKFEIESDEKELTIPSELLFSFIENINKKSNDGLLKKIFNDFQITNINDIEKIYMEAPLFFIDKKDKDLIYINESFLFNKFIPQVSPKTNISGLSSDISNNIKNLFHRYHGETINGVKLNHITKEELKNNNNRIQYIELYENCSKTLDLTFELLSNNFIPYCDTISMLVKTYFRTNTLSEFEKLRITKKYIQEIKVIKSLINKKSEISVINIISLLMKNIKSIYNSCNISLQKDKEIQNDLFEQYHQLNRLVSLYNGKLNTLINDINLLLNEILAIEKNIEFFIKVNEFRETLNSFDKDVRSSIIKIENENKIINYLNIKTNDSILLKNVVETSNLNKSKDSIENLFNDCLAIDYKTKEIINPLEITISQEEVEKSFKEKQLKIKQFEKLLFKEIEKLNNNLINEMNTNNTYYRILFNNIMKTYDIEIIKESLDNLYDMQKIDTNWLVFMNVFKLLCEKEPEILIKNIKGK